MVAIKITGISWRIVKLKLREPLQVAFGTVTESDNILLKIETDSGLSGYGEAAPLTFVTGETCQSVIAVLDLFRRMLRGVNPLDISAAHRLMNRIAYGNPSAKCAVDLALHDLWGKAEGKPVYQLLGSQGNTVQSDITIGIEAPEQMAAQARYYTEELGYRILKIKIGADPDTDLEALKQIRDTVGRAVRLRVDANQGYTVESALTAMEAFRQLDIEAVEQPLPYWDFDGSVKLKEKSDGMTIMLDESIHSHHDAVRALSIGAADILNIKLMKCGGLAAGVRIGDAALDNNASCMVGCMLESRLAITAGLSLAAAHPAVMEADCDSFLLCDDSGLGMTGGFTAAGDLMKLTDEPGFGVTVEF